MEVLNQARVLKAKKAFSTRRVPVESMKALNTEPSALNAGDVVLARVTSIGKHTRVELATGRKAGLLVGDEVILALGNRYAPDQYEAVVPDQIGPCHMVAGGGIAAVTLSQNTKISGPTQIDVLGVLVDDTAKTINVGDYAMKPVAFSRPQHVVSVFGTSMNAGKTTAVACLVKAFADAGYKVGAAKVTGTGSGNDLWTMRDFGAEVAYDFTDVGFASTFKTPVHLIEKGARTLVTAIAHAGCDVAVLEIADGLYQAETEALSKSTAFANLSDGVFFAAGDAMGAVAGVQRLRNLGHNVLGAGGAMTQSPLAMREVVNAIDITVYDMNAMMNAASVPGWVDGLTDAIEPQQVTV